MHCLGLLLLLSWFSIGYSLPQPPQQPAVQSQPVAASPSPENEPAEENADGIPSWSARCFTKDQQVVCQPGVQPSTDTDTSRQTPAAKTVDLNTPVAVTVTGLTLGGLALWGRHESQKQKSNPGTVYVNKQLKILDQLLHPSDPHHACMKKCVKRVITQDIHNKGPWPGTDFVRVVGEHGVYNLCADPDHCNLPEPYWIQRAYAIDPAADAHEVKTWHLERVPVDQRDEPNQSEDGKSDGKNNDQSAFTRLVDVGKAAAHELPRRVQSSLNRGRPRRGRGFGGTWRGLPGFPR